MNKGEIHKLKEKHERASTASEHPSSQKAKLSKRLGGSIGCKDKTSSWDLTGLQYPMVVQLGSTAK